MWASQYLFLLVPHLLALFNTFTVLQSVYRRDKKEECGPLNIFILLEPHLFALYCILVVCEMYV